MTTLKAKRFNIKIINILRDRGQLYGLLDLVNEFSDKNWNFRDLAENPNIRVSDIVKDNRFISIPNKNFTNFPAQMGFVNYMATNINKQISDIKNNLNLDWGQTFYASYSDYFDCTDEEFVFLGEYFKKQKWGRDAMNKISMYIGDIEKVKRFPNFGWDFDHLLKWNKNIKRGDLKFLIDYLPKLEEESFLIRSFFRDRYDMKTLKEQIPFYEFKWDLEEISRYASLKDIFENPDINWDSYGLSLNPEIFTQSLTETSKMLGNHFDEVCLSVNESLTIDILRKEKHIKWDWHKITVSRFNITEILENLDLNFPLHLLCLRDDFTYEIYEKHKHLFITTETLRLIQSNKNINIAHMKSFPFLIPEGICLNPNIKLKDIVENPSFPWDFRLLSENLQPTFSELLEYGIFYSWDFTVLSRTIKITPEQVKNNKHFPWDFQSLSKNKFFMENDILEKEVLEKGRNNFYDKLKNIYDKNILKIISRYYI